MAQENVEVVKRATDAWNRGDRDAWLSNFASEGEWQTTGQFADEGVYRGQEGLKRLWAETREDLEDLSISASEIRVVREDTVFEHVITAGRGKRSGARFEQPIWGVVRLRDGLIVRVETYVARGPALEAVGLRE